VHCFLFTRNSSGKAEKRAAERLRLRRCVSELWFVVLVVAQAALPAATSTAVFTAPRRPSTLGKNYTTAGSPLSIGKRLFE